MIYHSAITTEHVRAYAKVNPTAQLKVLISHGSIDNHNNGFLFGDRNLISGLALDSGTWSKNNNAKLRDKITFDGYADYLRVASNKFDWYFSFDEDFSREGFDINLSYQNDLEGRGFKPVPVIHDCYSAEEVNYYIDRGYEMVAIGSGELAKSNVVELYRITDKFHSKGIKVHYLGCTEFEKLANTPVYSCDSSSWNQKAPRGYILYWNPEKQGFNKTDTIDFGANRYGRVFYKDYDYRWQLEDYLNRELGLSCSDLVGTEGRMNRVLTTIHYFVQMEERIAELHKQYGFAW